MLSLLPVETQARIVRMLDVRSAGSLSLANKAALAVVRAHHPRLMCVEALPIFRRAADLAPLYEALHAESARRRRESAKRMRPEVVELGMKKATGTSPDEKLCAFHECTRPVGFKCRRTGAYCQNNYLCKEHAESYVCDVCVTPSFCFGCNLNWRDHTVEQVHVGCKACGARVCFPCRTEIAAVYRTKGVCARCALEQVASATNEPAPLDPLSDYKALEFLGYQDPNHSRLIACAFGVI